MSETGHIGINLAIWGVVTGCAVALLVAFMPHWEVWVSVLLWLVLWLVAILGISESESRRFLAGTLRKSSYTQIYTTLTRRNVMWVWRRYCDEASDRDSLPALFRTALTWRLYDTALLLAVAYPLLLLVGQWVVTGGEGRVGSFVVMPEAGFWPERALITGALFLFIGGNLGHHMKSGISLQPRERRTARRLVRMIGFAAAVVGLGVVGFADDLDGASAFAVVVLLAGVIAYTILDRAYPKGVVAFMSGLAFALGAAASGAGAILIASAFVGSVVAFLVLEMLSFRGTAAMTVLAVSLGGIAFASLAGYFGDWRVVSETVRTLFLFLAVFPLINALFDVLSYAVTLSLLRRGLRSGLPVFWALMDLAIACVLFLALGATLVAVIHGLNLLAGVPLLDLGVLFAAVREAPGAHVWLFLMLFSTILPTALHLLVSLLGLQGIWPRRLRRPVAVWIEGAPESPGLAVRAALALGLVWAIPLGVLVAALFGLWAFGGGLVLEFLDGYFRLLLWIAHIPVGVF